ncbi:MAG: prepilin peptidase [Candidatus Omnitrophica bacterium]|nr:prepilin peptidase [Candidatus Omnitrophota bacterium]
MFEENDLGILIFMFGAIVGSFLNVCIVRLPKGQSLVTPGSYCPKCLQSIVWYDNIPLLSWLVLTGKCRQCKAVISFRYWLVECLTATVFYLFYRHYGLDWVLPAYGVMVSGFIVAAFVDFAERIIPDEVSVGGMGAGLVLSVLVPRLHTPGHEELLLGSFLAGALVLACIGLGFIYPVFCKHLMDKEDALADRMVKGLVLGSLIVITLINANAPHLPAGQAGLLALSASLSGLIVGGGAVYAMGLVGDIIFKKPSMGGGDVKLMAMAGAFLGWKLVLLAFFIAPFFGAVYGIIEKIRTKDSAIAYGPFLITGVLVSQFWGEQIITWVLNGGIYGS